MENALLYTFSTIAQALGGAFALLSAFVLYSFQSLTATMWEDSASLRELLHPYLDPMSYELARSTGDYEKLVCDTLVGLGVAGIDAGPPFFGAQYGRFMRLSNDVDVRADTLDGFKKSGFNTGVVLIGSVWVIPFAQVIKGWGGGAWVILFIGALAFGFCLWGYSDVINLALRIQKPSEDRARRRIAICSERMEEEKRRRNSS